MGLASLASGSERRLSVWPDLHTMSNMCDLIYIKKKL